MHPIEQQSGWSAEGNRVVGIDDNHHFITLLYVQSAINPILHMTSVARYTIRSASGGFSTSIPHKKWNVFAVAWRQQIYKGWKNNSVATNLVTNDGSFSYKKGIYFATPFIGKLSFFWWEGCMVWGDEKTNASNHSRKSSRIIYIKRMCVIFRNT